MVKNPYVDMSKKELKEIYEDIGLSEKETKRVESFVPYAMELKEYIGGAFTLSDAIELAKRDYYNEVSKRFFI